MESELWASDDDGLAKTFGFRRHKDDTLSYYDASIKYDSEYKNRCRFHWVIDYWFDSTYDRMTKRLDGAGYHYYYYHGIDGSTDGAGQLRYINGPWSYDSQYYFYDDAGRVDFREILQSSSYPNIEHETGLTFDVLGRVGAITGKLGTFDIAYSGNSGLVDHVDYPNGQYTGFQYLPASQGQFLEKVSHLTGPTGSVIAEHTYTHSDSGQIETWRRNVPGHYDRTYSMTAAGSYDDTYRLESVSQTGGGASSFDYTYDAAGNRTSKKVGSTTYAYGTPNTRNQLTGNGLTYDSNGNILTHVDPETGERHLYQWDSINRLAVVETDKDNDGVFEAGDTRSEFSYDGLSRRYKIVEKSRSGSTWVIDSTNYFLWCGGEICQKRVGSTSYTAIKNNYYAGMGETRHTSTSNKTDYHYLTDHLGSVREVTNDSKTLQGVYDYTPYGKQGAGVYEWGGFAADFGYTGHFHHAPTATPLAWFRGYHAGMGRWLSGDPIGEAGGFNLYAYVGGSPIDWYDESGLGPKRATGAIKGNDESLGFEWVKVQFLPAIQAAICCFLAGGLG